MGGVEEVVVVVGSTTELPAPDDDRHEKRGRVPTATSSLFPAIRTSLTAWVCSLCVLSERRAERLHVTMGAGE